MGKTEFDIIRDYFVDAGLCFEREYIRLGSGDDGAVLDVPAGSALVISSDVLVAGRHFPADADPGCIANRVLAVNLSDLAAMAAEPLCFTLGLTLPAADHDWLTGFGAGLRELAQQYNCPLVGGDLNRGPLNIAVQVQGLVSGEPPLRSAAVPGDNIYVSGTLGDGAVALPVLGIDSHLGEEFALAPDADRHRAWFEDAYYRPRPRIALARALRPLMHACIDVSDGLAGDLGHILKASSVGARLRVDSLPISAAVTASVKRDDALRAALFGGDDYELCFTAAADKDSEIRRLATEIGIGLSCVGQVIDEPGLDFLDEKGHSLAFDNHSFRHF